MATLEDEVRVLKEKNSELVQKVQYWKLAAAAKDNEKLELMKEINELRLNLVRLKTGGAAQARKLDEALQSNSEKALSHLVQASNAVARTLELAKTYIQDRQDLDNTLHKWSALGGTPKSDRVHRVPPMIMGGQSIQPVVSLSRTMLNSSNSLTESRNSNQNRIITERAVPMHMLQDVYIPLRRIDASDFPGPSMEIEMEANDEEDSTEGAELEDSVERSVESEEDDYNSSRRLEPVVEDLEPENEGIIPPSRRSRAENPLEGPSWLLDRPAISRSRPKSYKSRPLEPDSTTEPDGNGRTAARLSQRAELETRLPPAPAFSPTIRRAKRTNSPPRPPSLSPLAMTPTPRGSFAPIATSSRRNSNSGRVLKVLVAKMRLDGGDDENNDVSPPKRPSLSSPVRDASPNKRFMRFDAPSPNGATDSRVIVSEDTIEDRTNGAWMVGGVTARRDNRRTSLDNRRTQDRAADAEGLSGQLASTDSSSHISNTSDNLANEDEEESAADNVGDRRRRACNRDMCGSAGDSDDSHEQSVEDKRDSVGDGQNRLGGKCSRDGRKLDSVGVRRGFVDSHKRRLGSAADGNGSVGDGHSRVGSAGDGHSRFGSVGDSDSSSNELLGEGRTRRPRKAVTYKEKPLNRKMRR